MDQARREAFQAGLKMMDQVYGPSVGEKVRAAGEPSPYMEETVSHLFGKVWAGGKMSIRDRRLAIIGASAMIGRQDLIEVQTKAALLNGELTPEELDELVLILAYYVGWPNSTALSRGVSAAVAAHGAASPKA